MSNEIASFAEHMIEAFVQGSQSDDPINPKHYKNYPVEAIDIMVATFGKEATRQYCLLTAFKYRMRLGHKDSIEQDLKKEDWYLNKYKELSGGKTNG